MEKRDPTEQYSYREVSTAFFFIIEKMIAELDDGSMMEVVTQIRQKARDLREDGADLSPERKAERERAAVLLEHLVEDWVV